MTEPGTINDTDAVHSDRPRSAPRGRIVDGAAGAGRRRRGGVVLGALFVASALCSAVTREKSSAPTGELLPAVREYPVRHNGSAGNSLIWYSRDFSKVTYRQLLVALHFQTHYFTVFGEGRERRRRCGILLADTAVPSGGPL